jgi:hypothetical protein
MSFQGATRTDPDGRSLAHPVLISDDWRQSDPRDKDGGRAVEGAIGQPEQEYGSKRSGVSGCRRRSVRHHCPMSRARNTLRLSRFPGTA